MGEPQSYRTAVTLETGLADTVVMVVGDADTAIAFGSGDVPVLATPRVVALCEEATCAAVTSALDAGQTTVGTRVELEHLAATAVGATVTATATVEAVDGRALRFAVTATDETGRLLARGTVERVAVDRQRFLDRLG